MKVLYFNKYSNIMGTKRNNLRVSNERCQPYFWEAPLTSGTLGGTDCVGFKGSKLWNQYNNCTALKPISWKQKPIVTIYIF